jgi:hypothetical protein
LFYIWYFYTFLKLSSLLTMYLYDFNFDWYKKMKII